MGSIPCPRLTNTVKGHSMLSTGNNTLYGTSQQWVYIFGLRGVGNGVITPSSHHTSSTRRMVVVPLGGATGGSDGYVGALVVATPI